MRDRKNNELSILKHEVVMEAEAERNHLQPNQEAENIEDLNQSTFSDKHPNWAPLQMGAAQRYFDEQMANQSQ